MRGFTYSLHVQGVWGRKRKASFDSFEMGTDRELLTRAAIDARALNMLATASHPTGPRANRRSNKRRRGRRG